MSARRTERLLNLTMCLMAGRRPLSKATIRGLIADYREATSDESFERMFERDKDDLREMGIPLVTESIDPLFDDEVGYRIDPSAYALPEIEVGPDEMAVLTLAARAWQQAALAPAAAAALRKVEAYARDAAPGDPEPASDGIGLEPRVSTSEVAFGPLYEAVRDRRPVRFGYRTPQSPDATERHLEPWGVVSWHGRWYVAGHDRDRDATRVFRLGRIIGEVSTDGPAGSVVVPDDIDPATVVALIAPDAPNRDATVRVRHGEGHALRLAATAADADGDAHDLLTVPFRDEWSFAADVVAAKGIALAPPELRQAAIDRLHAILDADASSVGGTA